MCNVKNNGVADSDLKFKIECPYCETVFEFESLDEFVRFLKECCNTDDDYIDFTTFTCPDCLDEEISMRNVFNNQCED